MILIMIVIIKVIEMIKDYNIFLFEDNNRRNNHIDNDIDN